MDAKQITADVVIAGGSLVGALTGVMLARQRPDWQVVVCEPRLEGPPNDKRIIALAAASAARLQRLDVLGELTDATPIRHIHISDKGYLGATEIHAEQEQVDALGYVVSAAELVNRFYLACQQLDNVTWLAGESVEQLHHETDKVQVETVSGAVIDTQLVIGADGQNSKIRSLCQLPWQVEDYQQIGCISTVKLDRDLQGWAYERFTEFGPMALLPMANQQASLVWTFNPEQAETAKQWSSAEFLTRCQRAFGYRAGRLTARSEPVFYPLQLKKALRSTYHRTVIIGNASHALHPIAGQGFNLGLRDVECLVQVLTEAVDPGTFAVLDAYQQSRTRDYDAIINLTDGLVRGFSNNNRLMVVPRNLALMTLQHCAPLRSRFARLTMGMKS